MLSLICLAPFVVVILRATLRTLAAQAAPREDGRRAAEGRSPRPSLLEASDHDATASE